MFTYQCGLLEWSGDATVGFTSSGRFYQNHYLSGTPSVRNIACLNSPRSVWSNLVYQLSKLSNNKTQYAYRELLTSSGDDYLSFLDMDSTSEVTSIDLPSAVNGSSEAVNIPGGFPLGTTNQTSVYVSTFCVDTSVRNISNTKLNIIV